MSADSGPARRFLHMCHNCAEAAPVTNLLVQGLAMRHTMTSPTKYRSQDLLGFGRAVSGGADFVYDARGPRHGPSIEAGNWEDPPVTGAAHTDPTAVGLHAVGFLVPELNS